MKIVRYVKDGNESYGLLEKTGIIDILKLSEKKGKKTPSSIEDLISLGNKGEKLLKKIVGKLSIAEKKMILIKNNKVCFLSPIDSPSKIVCLGLNYKDHAEEAKAQLPDEPIIFMKPKTAIIGPEESIIKPRFVQCLDYEAELAIVIGKKGKNIQYSDVNQHVFGYTILNDVSARDIQFKDGQWTRGKSFDTFAPIGPCIVTRNQIKNPNDLKISTRVNSHLRQNSSTSHMIFNIQDIIVQLSRVMTLEPNDIIATGTPAGVAAFMKPKPQYLKPGDIVEVSIEEIGKLRNTVEADI
jgi:2-keto-4-pentenoate hydratase/2-oxohepta-3-ene-1,7-dioic acid hydratase in catechol pathway